MPPPGKFIAYEAEASRHVEFTRNRTFVRLSVPNPEIRELLDEHDADERELLHEGLAHGIGVAALDAILEEWYQ